MQTIILAAGDGGRLHPATASRPKPLLPLAGRPIIDYVLDAFVACGLREFIVVVGYEGAQIQRHLLPRQDVAINFAWNADPLAGNARSLSNAAPLLRPAPFLLAMADHLQSPTSIQAAIHAPPGSSWVMVDSLAPLDVQMEGTRVQLGPDGSVRAIGKNLPAWDAIDIGLFRLEPTALEHVRLLPPAAELNDAWQTLVAAGGLRAIDVAGAWWADIDTAVDLARAETALMEARSNAARRPGLALP
ncbi:MAG TPA: NTP transferase domain-containing protein [Dehalococcoidia bacterium]|nr:NTP transferase domain-containing protein [Dehalococcoidia bacterium]